MRFVTACAALLREKTQAPVCECPDQHKTSHSGRGGGGLRVCVAALLNATMQARSQGMQTSCEGRGSSCWCFYRATGEKQNERIIFNEQKCK